MRIIGGERKGNKLAEWHGLPVRPLRDRVRTALFDVLRELVMGADVLDLFAGTGAVGLEALSRGASRATLVELSPRVAHLIQENVRRLDYQDKARILPGDALERIRELASRGEQFDLVFIGAPYNTHLGRKALQTMSEYPPLKPQAIVVVEVHDKESLSERHGPLQLERRRAYGETRLDFFRFVPERRSD
ncbi:MAG: 16S rRNA (guanine(966)-N(2))-methyltransferase RsmD [Candidatus Bipolaricaulota bacterium]